MSQIEIDIIISNIGIEDNDGVLIPMDKLEIHKSGNIHLKLKAMPSTKSKTSHIIFFNNKFVGNADIIESSERNNIIELPPNSTIDNLPF